MENAMIDDQHLYILLIKGFELKISRHVDLHAANLIMQCNIERATFISTKINAYNCAPRIF